MHRKLWLQLQRTIKTLWEPAPQRQRHKDWDPEEFNKGKKTSKQLRGLQHIRMRLRQTLEGKRAQEMLAAVILLDSCVVFLECIVDAIIDERKDMAGTVNAVASAVKY